MPAQSADPIVIVGYARTPMGALLGDLASLPANELGAIAIKGALADAKLDPHAVDSVVMGNVLSAGQGQAPARQAALKAGLEKSTHAMGVSKVCGSGLQAVTVAAQALMAHDAEVVVAGGMESMTNAPHLLPTHRAGFKYGRDTLYDHMALDGLEDAYDHKPMGAHADATAAKYQLTREAQDAYAIETLRRAQEATAGGKFKREIVPVTIKDRKGDIVVLDDELPRKARPEKIPTLKPAFTPEGTITAANASGISDGAAALVLMRLSEAEKRGLKPIAKIVATGSHSHEPELFTTAPVGAMKAALAKAGWDVGDVDLWEINEAFAMVPMIAMQELGITHDKVNIHGGACAMGHPIGASGARILATLLSALEQTGGKRGVASLCIGGGEGVATAVEML
jgi:acetyl-CoA C-acetyltransferase